MMPKATYAALIMEIASQAIDLVAKAGASQAKIDSQLWSGLVSLVGQAKQAREARSLVGRLMGAVGAWFIRRAK